MDKKFKVLIRQFDDIRPDKQFKVSEVEAEDKEKAWEIVDTELANSTTQEWILTEAEFEALLVALCGFSFAGLTAKTDALNQIIINLVIGAELNREQQEYIKRIKQ